MVELCATPAPLMIQVPPTNLQPAWKKCEQKTYNVLLMCPHAITNTSYALANRAVMS